MDLGTTFTARYSSSSTVVRQIHGTGPSISQFSAQPIFAKQNAFDKIFTPPFGDTTSCDYSNIDTPILNHLVDVKTD